MSPLVKEMEGNPARWLGALCSPLVGKLVNVNKNKNKNKNIYLSSLGMYKHKMGKQARYKIFDF